MPLLSLMLPVFIIIISNTVYNIAAKSSPKNINQFAMLVIVYLISAVFSFIMLLITDKGKISQIPAQIKENNWISVLLAIAVVGIETGYLLAFKRGWRISQCSVISNICLAIILVFVGILMFTENIPSNQIIGIGICIVGLVVMNKK